MYAKYSKIVHVKANDDKEIMETRYQPKPYHHVKLDTEFKRDCQVWKTFLVDQELMTVVNRPMIDLAETIFASEISFYSDANGAKNLGFGCILNRRWLFGQWDQQFMVQNSPSIEYLELFALCAGLITWQDQPKLNNCRIVIFCNNQAVVSMVNNITSSCPQCMYLLRLLVFNGLIHNCRVFVKYINTKNNFLADALSCLDLPRFCRLGGNMMNTFPDNVHHSLWPLTKIWQKF